MAPNPTLLRGGTVLIHDAENHVQAIKADLLIEGNKITKIEAEISPSQGTKIIDCVNKIISPGFIDTHHHVWQTLLKGRHANQQLLEYMYHGFFISSLHSPSDLFWGQLGGSLECLDVGTTTVVDHAHLNYSPDHSKAALAATISSGIRSIFCYSPTPQLKSWKPFSVKENLLEDWVLETLQDLAAKGPFSDGRVQLGFGFDAWYLPREMVVDLFQKVKGLGIKLVTCHSVRSIVTGFRSLQEVVNGHGLLDSSILFSHATGCSVSDAALIKKTGSHVSSTPSTELQMGHGFPVALNTDLDFQDSCSIGVDCQSNNSASIATEMRLLLQSARGLSNESFSKAEKFPAKVYKTVEDVFNLGTIGGARAIGMEDKIGSLAVGKLADIIIFDGLSTGMICAAQKDPVAAVVLHSHPSDIEMVIVDGVVRKEDSKLRSVDVKAGREVWGEDQVKTESLEWKDVAVELLKRQEALSQEIDKLDMEEARAGVVRAFHIDESKIVPKV
ncbi:hypothetical protein PVAG01_05920 [Phlyctema vagabunda]|uniref:Amidohydrolase-related domain-containing protein n=1 Tax=Phlyctema vagabunda TaxID=108571 RepID=A0ABR4PEK9_9HELO